MAWSSTVSSSTVILWASGNSELAAYFLIGFQPRPRKARQKSRAPPTQVTSYRPTPTNFRDFQPFSDVLLNLSSKNYKKHNSEMTESPLSLFPTPGDTVWLRGSSGIILKNAKFLRKSFVYFHEEGKVEFIPQNCYPKSPLPKAVSSNVSFYVTFFSDLFFQLSTRPFLEE